MRVAKFAPTERFGSNMYILISGSEAAVIDPSVEYFKLEKFIRSENISFKYVLLTHAHFDHILEINEWVSETDAEVVIGVDDAPMLSDSYLNCYSLFSGRDEGYFGSYKAVNDGDILQLGNEIIKVIHTPGHTPGSVTYSVGDALFVGDTLFFGGSYGRCDLPGGDEAKIFSSITHLLSQNENKTVYSGHGPDTTVKELKSNFI